MQNETPVVDIVIVDYDAWPLVVRCLRSIADYETGRVRIGRVVVVENGATQPDPATVEHISLPLAIMWDGRNRGFAAGCNTGARFSEADFLLFLNPDTVLKPGVLDAPAIYMERHENLDVGIVGVQLIGEDGQASRTCSRFPRARHYLYKALGLNRISPRFFPVGFMTEWDHNAEREVDLVMGAFYYVRRSLFDRLGGFDEQFFVYFEEDDFALRARRLGFRTMFLPEVHCYHQGQGTTEKLKAVRLFYSLRSRLRFGLKHFHAPSAMALIMITVCIEPLSRMISAIMKRSWADARETVLAYLMLLQSFGRVLRAGYGNPLAWQSSQTDQSGD